MTLEAPTTKRRGRVLVVDDSPATLASLCELLYEDHEVIFATSGQEAIDMAHSHNPDLILLDVVMPEMDGFEVCSRLKSSPGTIDIPVVFITSMGDDVDHLQGLNVGAIDYIEKPISPEVVRVRVKNHIQMKHKQDTLRGLTLRDGLTGIANRRRFDEALREEWSRAARSQSRLSLIMIDIDHFKLFNDTYGHPEGDVCLARLGETLAQIAADTMGFAGRYGGEEFCLLLPNTAVDRAMEIGEKVRAAVQDIAMPHATSSYQTVTVSVGVACAKPNDTQRSGDLIEAADAALYAAKHRGRNAVVEHGFVRLTDGAVALAG